MPNWTFVILILVAAAVAVMSARQAAARSRQLAAWARQRGLTFTSGPDRELAVHFSEFAALNRGREQTARNICHGQLDGREVWAFDLRQLGRTHDDGDHQATIVMAKADFPLIPLHIRHETALDRFGEALGLNDIDFESAAFSNRFHVTAADRRWAYDVIHPRMMEYLLETAAWPLELGGWYCLVTCPGRLSPEAWDRALALARGVLDRIPDRVRREMLGQTRRGPRQEA